MTKNLDINSCIQGAGTSEPRWYKRTSVRYFQVAMLAISLGGLSSLAYAMYAFVVGLRVAACADVGFWVLLMVSLFPAFFGLALLRVGILGSLQSFHRPSKISHREALLEGLGLVIVLLLASTFIGSEFQRGVMLNEQTAALQRSIKINEFVDRMALPTQERLTMVTKVTAMSDAALQNAGILPLTCK